MPSPICTTASTIQCPHGGVATLLTSNTVARAQGAFVLLETDVHTVAGCPFYRGDSYSPCVTIRWSAAATKCTVNGVAALLQSSTGVCYSASQAPQGTALITQVQPMAQGT